MGNENHDKGKSVEQGTDSGIGGRIEVETVNQRVSHPEIVIQSAALTTGHTGHVHKESTCG